jgi:hypothetical protein
MIDIVEQIACARRELNYRRRVYARFVKANRMSQKKADHEIAAMEAILETLEAQKTRWDLMLPPVVDLLSDG